MHADPQLKLAQEQVKGALRGAAHSPVVTAFFHEPTFTASYVVHDPALKRAAIIDPVLDFDQASGRTSTEFADTMIEYIESEGLTVDWLLETHAHADHLSAAEFLKAKLGGQTAIGRDIITVQNVFGEVFNEADDFARDGAQFDHLFADGERIEIGEIPFTALHVPGHTPADMAYIIGDAAFVGDTMFMPDYGTARADFPGGDAATLYRSIRRLMELPAETRVFLCHDYKAPDRTDFVWETTMGAQRSGNIHANEQVPEDEFVAMREARDATLGMPKLILPSIQINIRCGQFPKAEDNGTSYLKLPLNTL